MLRIETKARARALLIDSQQIDSGQAIPPAFLDVYKDEIDTFRREKAHREGAEARRRNGKHSGKEAHDQTLLV